MKNLTIKSEKITRTKKIYDPCEKCKKCGETTCGNDKNYSCFEKR